MFFWSVNICFVAYARSSNIYVFVFIAEVSISVFLLSGLAVICCGVLSSFNAPKLHRHQLFYMVVLHVLHGNPSLKTRIVV